jgi:aquaporin Z
MNPALTWDLALRRHWPEYLIEAWALGMFMVSAGVIVTLVEGTGSPLQHAGTDAIWRRALTGCAMGATAIALIYSPWGQRSGAHMNPAVTLAFWRLGKVASWDAVFYVLAQFAGGLLGVELVGLLLRDAFTAPPILYLATLPGSYGVPAAFASELTISALLMTVVLRVSNAARYAKFTGLCAGALVCLYITVEAPVSGMSMNPARSFASALPASQFADLWIYFLAPISGMQAAAAWYSFRRGSAAVRCAKLVHPDDRRCIHCGHIPRVDTATGVPTAS